MKMFIFNAIFIIINPHWSNQIERGVESETIFKKNVAKWKLAI
jgi:hypothetical protein